MCLDLLSSSVGFCCAGFAAVLRALMEPKYGCCLTDLIVSKDNYQRPLLLASFLKSCVSSITDCKVAWHKNSMASEQHGIQTAWRKQCGATQGCMA